MDVRFSCHNCGQHIDAPEEMAGQRVNCPGCQQPLTVPNRSIIPMESKPDAKDISFDCAKCGQHVIIAAELAGQLVDCPKCGTKIVVPYESTTPAIVPNASAVPNLVSAITKKCPICSQEVCVDAIKCRHCGEFLNADAARRVQATEEPLPVANQQLPIPKTVDGGAEWLTKLTWLIGLITLGICVVHNLNIYELVGVVLVLIVVVIGFVSGLKKASGLVGVLLLLASPIMIAVILLNCDVNPYLLARLWRQSTNILDIDSLAGTIGLTGKWVKEGSYDKAVYLEFFSDKTLTFHTTETPIAGKWTVLSDGRIKYDLSLPLGATGTFLCELEGQTLLVDVDGKKVRYVRM